MKRSTVFIALILFITSAVVAQYGGYSKGMSFATINNLISEFSGDRENLSVDGGALVFDNTFDALEIGGNAASGDKIYAETSGSVARFRLKSTHVNGAASLELDGKGTGTGGLVFNNNAAPGLGLFFTPNNITNGGLGVYSYALSAYMFRVSQGGGANFGTAGRPASPANNSFYISADGDSIWVYNGGVWRGALLE